MPVQFVPYKTEATVE